MTTLARTCSLAVMALLALGAYTRAQADIYKWVDTNGLTHYSEEPPSTGKYQVIQSAPPAPANPAGAAPAQAQPAKPAAPQPQANAQLSPAAQKQHAENCLRAKQTLGILETRSHILATDASGQQVRLTEEQRQAKITEIKQKLAKYCNDGNQKGKGSSD
ncbi:MAG: DUF4124 domain-containing protein [Gammaproteobacteria bacterium]|nr:DUF4124 domain-containing protein [Gammaproteobacteria bacterium]